MKTRSEVTEGLARRIEELAVLVRSGSIDVVACISLDKASKERVTYWGSVDCNYSSLVLMGLIERLKSAVNESLRNENE